MKHCLSICDQLHQATARNLLQPFPNQLGRADIFQVATNDTAELYFFDINAFLLRWMTWLYSYEVDEGVAVP